MYNIRKIVSFVIVVMMLLSLNPTIMANSETILDEYEIQLLSNLNIIGPDWLLDEEKLNSHVTRDEFVSYIMKLIKIDSSGTNITNLPFNDISKSKYCEDIVSAHRLGIVKGFGGNFNPGVSISYDEACKMLIGILGYSTYAENNGGFPFGYMYAASKNGLLNGVNISSDNIVDYKNAAKLLFNALQIDMLNVNGVLIANDDIFLKYTDDGINILQKYHNVYKEEGIATGVTYYNSPRSNIQITVNGKKFDISNSDDLNCIGMLVDIYYRYSEDDNTSEIVTIIPDKNNGITTIKSENIKGHSYGLYEYYDDDTGKAKTIKYDRSGTFMYNGFECNTLTASEYVPVRGEVTIIDNDCDGTGDYVIIYEYENYFVSKVAKEEQKIYERITPGEEKVLSLNEDEYRFVEIYHRGIKSDFSAIKESTVVSAYVSKNRDVCLAVISENIVTGVLRLISDGECVIEGETYIFSDDATLNVALGEYGVFYLDARGYIYYSEKSAEAEENKKFGFMTNAKIQTNSFGRNVMIKILNTDGNFIILTCADKVMVDGAKCSSVDEIFSKIFDRSKTAGQNRKLLLYELDNKGYVKLIDTPNMNINEELTNPDDCLQVSMNYANTYKYVNTNGFADVNIRQPAIMKETCYVFKIPTDTDALDDEYDVLPLSYFTGSVKYTVECYKSDTGYSDVVLYYTDKLSGSAYDEKTRPVVVSGIVQKFDKDSNSVGLCIEGARNGSVDYVAEVDDRLDIKSLECGDIIAIDEDTDGTITDICLLYDFSEKLSLYPNASFSNTRVTYGRIKEIEDTLLTVETSGGDYLLTTTSIRGGTNVYIATRDGYQLKSVDYLEEGMFIAAVATDELLFDIVVY